MVLIKLGLTKGEAHYVENRDDLGDRGPHFGAWSIAIRLRGTHEQFGRDADVSGGEFRSI